MLIRKPGFTLTVAITLALGTGANAAVFSLVNAGLLTPLPLSESEQLMMLYTETPRNSWGASAYADLMDWRAESQSFSELSALVDFGVNLTGRGEPSRVLSGFVSANFFKLLRVEAASGRTFLPGEDDQGAERVIILSHAVWQNQFGADPMLIGQALNVDGHLFTVVGILPRDFYFHWGDFEVWMPIQYHPDFSQTDRKKSSTFVIGRLKAGVKPGQARAEIDGIAERLSALYPVTNKDRGVMMIGLKDQLTKDLREPFLILLAVTALMLLIACANIANLMLARSTSRQKEIALRVALGAGRWRIVRQLLTESVVIAIFGGTLGLLVGVWGKDLILYGGPVLSPNRQSLLPPGLIARLDFTMLGFTFAVAIMAGIIPGLIPALRFSVRDVYQTLREGDKAGREGTGSRRLRGALIVTQTALTLVLLIGTGLLVKSFRALLSVDSGFNPKNVLTLEYELPDNKYPEPAAQWAFHQQAVERVRALPGVIDASAALILPQTGRYGTRAFIPLDRPEPLAGEEPQAQFNRADQYYFQTIGIPLIRGRVFTEQDGPGSQPVAVINQAMAERFWPGEDPVGTSLRFTGAGDSGVTDRTAQVVGIVGNIKNYKPDEPAAAQIYLAFAQTPSGFARLVVRTAGDSLAAAPAVKQAVWSLDKDQPVWKVRTLQSLLDRAVGGSRFMTQLVSCFSALALSLAVVGIYGVISYFVSRRTHEIGIRTALGAQPRDIIKLVVGHGMVLILSGVAIGLAVAFALSRYIKTLLFDVEPTDIFTYLSVSLLLVLVSLSACYLPARRAAKVDPNVALRCE
jgi:putative ABC transport system permease protein